LAFCATARPLCTRFAKIIGASFSEATMQPNPKVDCIANLREFTQVRKMRCRPRRGANLSLLRPLQTGLCRRLAEACPHPTGMRGPACIPWAALTPFLAAVLDRRRARGRDAPAGAGAGGAGGERTLLYSRAYNSAYSSSFESEQRGALRQRKLPHRRDLALGVALALGRHCHPTLSLTAIGCHASGVCTLILLPFPASMTVPPTARWRTRRGCCTSGRTRTSCYSTRRPSRLPPRPPGTGRPVIPNPCIVCMEKNH
jgi:hypothetical protein